MKMNFKPKIIPPNSVLTVPKLLLEKPEMTCNVFEKILENENKNEKVEFIVNIRTIELFSNRYFCIVQDGSKKLLKCMFSKTLSAKIPPISISPQRYIKITDYYLHRFDASTLKSDSTSKFIDLIGVTDLVIINVFKDRRQSSDRTPIVNPQQFSAKIKPSRPIRQITPNVPRKPLCEAIRPDKLVPSANTTPKPLVESNTGETNTDKISMLQICSKSDKVINGKIKLLTESLTKPDQIYFLITDSTGVIICWTYGFIAKLLKNYIKDDFKITVSEALVRKTTKVMSNVSSFGFEMVINATSSINIYDNDNKHVSSYKNRPPLELESIPSVKIPTVKYPLLRDIIKNHPQFNIEFIGIIVDQTYVIKTSTINVKRIIIQDESAKVTLTLWRDIADRFNIPNGEIIIGERCYTSINLNNVCFTSSDSARISQAMKCPDRLRLQHWYIHQQSVNK